PFLVLLPRAAKRDGGVLVKIAAVLLVGRWLDLYLSVMPAVSPQSPVPGLAELGAALAAAGVLGLLLLHALQKAPAPADAALREPLGFPQHG
ncbi:MAG: quinol:cytochrome C oxidoreductase, partial [Pirellulales bacterium]|nr:quinol:cytochrome C oxidoreductase [Pirellulales bacterium]